MVSKMNPKAAMPRQSGKSAAAPTGKPAQREGKKIESAASKAKYEGGPAHLGAGIGNTT